MPKRSRSPVDHKALAESIRYSRDVLHPARRERYRAVQQYAGSHWTGDNSQKKTPINLLALYVQIVARNLIAKNPRVMLRTKRKNQAPVVDAMQQWMNEHIVKMRLAKTLQRTVIDALFSVGIMKVALSSPADASLRGWNLPAGTPFASLVDLEDFVYDVRARDFDEASYIGHRYRVPLESVQESGLYKKSVREKLTATDYPDTNEQGDDRIAQLRLQDIGRLEDSDFEEMVDLWEIYLPRRREIVTLATAENGSPEAEDEPLRVQEWVGPDCGPYHMLGFGLVPGSGLPKAPIMDLLDMHEFVNESTRKLFRQAGRQKVLTVFRRNNDADAGRINEANDGDAIGLDSPEGVTQMALGGPDPNLSNFMEVCRNLFSWLGGNLDSMGGLSPQAKTATQDKMLAENSSRGVADMQDTTVTFTSDVMESLAWFWHKDPFKTMETTFSVPGMPEFSSPRTVTPDQREQVRFEDLELLVDPYSLQHQTPGQRAGAMKQIVTEILIPAMPILQQQGIQLNMNFFLRKLGELLDQTDMPELVTLTEPPQIEESSGPSDPSSAMGPRPTNTNREYTRHNVSERTMTGTQQMLATAMQGVNAGGVRRPARMAPGPQMR